MIKDGECTICVNLAHTYRRGISGHRGFPLDYPTPFRFIFVLKENTKYILRLGGCGGVYFLIASHTAREGGTPPVSTGQGFS